MQNTYTGFDSEFECKDESKFLNILISVQTANQRRVILKVPLYNKNNIAYNHPLTIEISEFYQPGVNYNKGNLYTFTEVIKYNSAESKDSALNVNEFSELALLNNSIKCCISEIRKLLFTCNDESKKSIIEQANKVPKVK